MILRWFQLSYFFGIAFVFYIPHTPHSYRHVIIFLYIIVIIIIIIIIIRKRYVVKHNLITEVYLMTVMEITTCFGLYWPSSGCLGNLRASYMHARARGVEICYVS